VDRRTAQPAHQSTCRLLQTAHTRISEDQVKSHQIFVSHLNLISASFCFKMDRWMDPVSHFGGSQAFPFLLPNSALTSLSSSRPIHFPIPKCLSPSNLYFPYRKFATLPSIPLFPVLPPKWQTTACWQWRQTPTVRGDNSLAMSF